MPAAAEMSFGGGHAAARRGYAGGFAAARKVPCKQPCRVRSSPWRASSPPPCRTACRSTASSCRPAPPPCSSPSTPARAPSGPRRTGWPTSSSISCSRAAQKYDDYRKVNETAETMGAVLNAYTSHDLVAFHITCRAEVAAEAIDLLTDFVGRPKIDAEELDRERGVVIQEIARAHDQPSVVAEHLIDRAAFGDHPLGPPGAGPGGAPAHVHARRRSSPSGAASGRARAAARSWSATSSTCPRTASWPSRSAASRRSRPTAAPSRRRRSRRTTLVEARESNQSHLRMSYRPSIDPRDARRARRAERLLDAAGRLDGLAAVRRDPRAARPRLLRLRARPLVRRRADPAALGRAWSPASASRPTRACARSSTSCAPTARREEEVERARAYAAGRRVLAFENTNAVARHAAHPDRRVRPGHRPRRGDRGARRGDLRRRSSRSPAGISEELSVACVGPHDAGRVLIATPLACARAAVPRPQCVAGDASRSSTTASSSATCAGSRTGGRSTARCSAARASPTCAAPAPQRERGPEYVIVLVSEHFDGVPWLERVYVDRHAVGRLRDGRPGRRPRLHAGRVRAQARDAAGRARRGRVRASSCCPSTRSAANRLADAVCVTPGDTRVSQGHADSSRRRPSCCAPSPTSGWSRWRAAGTSGRSRRSSSATAGRCCARRGAICPRRGPRTRSSRRTSPRGARCSAATRCATCGRGCTGSSTTRALNQLRVAGYDYAELDEALRGRRRAEEELERRAVVRQTLTGLAALPERQREALLRIAVEGRSQEEVARELGRHRGRRAPARPPRAADAARGRDGGRPAAAGRVGGGAGSAAPGRRARADRRADRRRGRERVRWPRRARSPCSPRAPRSAGPAIVAVGRGAGRGASAAGRRGRAGAARGRA